MTTVKAHTAARLLREIAHLEELLRISKKPPHYDFELVAAFRYGYSDSREPGTELKLDLPKEIQDQILQYVKDQLAKAKQDLEKL